MKLRTSANAKERMPASAPARSLTGLMVAAGHDPLEAEADRMAAQVLAARADPVPGTAPLAIQRRTEEPAGPAETAPASVAATLAAGSGRPLEAGLRQEMEHGFGQDFSGVRVHSGALADQSAQDLNARAYTVKHALGSDIVFGPGEFAPQTRAGRHLLAHELAHVAQGAGARAAQARAGGGTRIRRKPKGEVILGEPEINPPEPQKEEWDRLQVKAIGMDNAALVLAAHLNFGGPRKRNLVFVGLHPKFVKVYDSSGKSIGNKIALKEVKGLVFAPGVYIQGPKGMVALTISSDDKKLGVEAGQSIVGQRPYTAEEKAAMAEEARKATDEGRAPKPAAPAALDFHAILSEPDRFRSMVESVPNALAVYFVPTYDLSQGGGSGGESKGIYASPIEGRADGQPANAPPWPVSVDGPKLVPVDSDPTFSAKIDWSANANYSLSSQVISQVGNSIHYKWELFDITQYAKKQLAADPAGTRQAAGAKPEKTLDERIADFTKSKRGAGTDVTGMGGANREFNREFEDWWKDTKRAAKGSVDAGGDTVRERMSNANANLLSLELAPVTLLTTAVGASLRWLADAFAGPRQQQEIPLKHEGIFLIRVITTPAIQEDRDNKPVIRPPSVAAKVAEVTPMERAVRESLDEPGAQMAELQAQIDRADKEGNVSKAAYLRDLLKEARQRFEGSPQTLLSEKRAKKQAELEQFRKDYPSLSDYSRVREVAMLDDQIALYARHEKQRSAGATTLAPMTRVNAALISEVSGEQYPLLISAGPMAMDGTQHQWMISDVTNREGDAFIGLGSTPSAAFLSALKKFGGNAAYGRGRIGVRTAGLGLEPAAPQEMFVDSAPADWALAEKRLDDLVTTLAALGLMVASAGTAGALIGAGVAAARLIQRWRAGKLYLDAQTVSDALGVLGGLGVAGALGAGLRIQKFDKVFALIEEGKVTETGIAAAAKALEGAQQLARGVELANEAINYGGLLWGNVSFIDQMMSIGEQESSGALTHAAARRARAGALSSAIQNNGFFIAGNVLKARQQAKAADKPGAKPTEKLPAETRPPGDQAPTRESGEPNEAQQAAGNAPQKVAPVPLSERRATLAELQAALPPDQRAMLTIDPRLEGDHVQVDYKLDPATGLIIDIRLTCGPDARPASVAVHAETVRTMQKYQGFSGRVRQALSWLADRIGVDTLKPENKVSFEAALEIRKLPKLIDAQLARMKNMEPNAHDLAEAELNHLELQLEQHLRTLGLGGEGEGAGYVAGKGLPKAKQKQYADLLARLRGLEPGSDAHRKIRREMYELIGGDMPLPTWEKVYEANVGRARKANAIVTAEHGRLGWGETEETIKLGKDEVRRLDIADVKKKKGIEVKAYETGYISASEDIVWEVERDAKLVKRGWDITWILIDTEPSGPLLDMLLKARIKVEVRTLEGGGKSKFVERL